MKKGLISLTVAAGVVLLFWLLSSQSKLGEIRIQSIFFRKGEKLSVAAKKFEKAIQDGGNDWFIIVDPRILERPANINFGARDAKNMTYLISKTYDAKSIIFEDKRLILFVSK
jgi:hypothetical protein